MPNNLAVAVSADVTDLQVKFAVAKAETSALTSEMNKLAKQSAAGILDPAGQAQLQQVAADLVKARAEAAALSAEFKEMTGATQGVGGVLEELRGKMHSALEFTGVAVAVEGIRMLGEAIEQMGERATQTQATSAVLDVTTDQVQAMQAAAKEAGTSMEVFTRAGERLNTMLFEARSNSGAAIEKLRDLGVTTADIANPAFKINDLLGELRERLLDAASHQETMNQLVKEFGTRAAAAGAAIQKYDGSEKGLAETMARLNGLSTEQIQKAHEMGVGLDEIGTAYSNTGAKGVLWMRDLGEWLQRNMRGVRQLSDALGVPQPKPQLPAQQVGVIDRGQETARAWADIQRDMQKQEMESAEAGVRVTKEGTEQRLEALRNYATAARQFYGGDDVNEVVKANQEIIAEQRKVNDAQKAGLEELTHFSWENDTQMYMSRLRLAEESVKIDQSYAKEVQKQQAELFGGWEEEYAKINTSHANMLKQQAADDAKNAKDQATAWKGAVSEIEGAEGTMVSDILSKRKSLSQSLIQLSGQMVMTEISNDLKAFTTKELLQDQEKATEQGGLLYHMFSQSQEAAATARSQAAQTSATIAGNSARLSSTETAAAVSKATSAEIGSKTVLQDAAKAFSGTYASVAQIPYVGWILAPAAASAAYAGVAAYEGLASLDTGTDYVPQDMIAQIHEGEAVVPRQFNPAAGGSASGYTEQHNYGGDIHINALDTGSINRMLARPGNRSAFVNAAVKSYRRGAR